jgi:hypothetical protein
MQKNLCIKIPEAKRILKMFYGAYLMFNITFHLTKAQNCVMLKSWHLLPNATSIRLKYKMWGEKPSLTNMMYRGRRQSQPS